MPSVPRRPATSMAHGCATGPVNRLRQWDACLAFTRDVGREALSVAKFAVAFVLDLVTPKRANQFYLSFHPDSDASIYPILSALNGGDCRVVRVMINPVPVDEPRRRGTDHVTVITCRAGSLRSYYHYLRSRYVLASHPIVGIRVPAPRKVTTYIGHGMPAKRLGRLDRDKARIFSDYVLATSEVFRPALSAAFGVPPDKIYIDHSPRVEAMCGWADRDVWRKLGIDRDSFRSVVVWAPSYRGEPGDGTSPDIRTGLYASTDLLSRLSDILLDLDALLVIKRHPYDRDPPIKGVPNVIEVRQSHLDNRQVGLYDMLAGADALVTDVSSVWIDFLLMDRPILIYVPDHDQFAQDRGFVLDPYEDWTPSRLITEEQDFVQAVRTTLESRDEHAQRRRTVAEVLLPHRGPIGASERLIEMMRATTG